MGEFDLIKKIGKILNSKIIGDDTAPIKIGNRTLVFTNDILLEDQHFLDYFPIDNLGWKAISVNVSDIVASGGIPKYVLISLLLPKYKTSLVEKIYQSINKACQSYGCTVIGGNISKSEKLGIDVFLIGTAKKFIGRRKAKPGDFVYLTGPIGDSKAGLELLMMKKNSYEVYEKKLIEKHLRPVIEVGFSKLVARYATASVDISDGLSSDVWHISDMSNVRIDIDSEKIPFSEDLKTFSKKYGKNLLDYGLTGGEDYQILFTSSEKISGKKNIYLIGRVGPGKNVYINKKIMKNKSFDHFCPL